MKPIYLDYNATTPVLPRVFEAMQPFFTAEFGNPASGHLWGLKAKRALDNARQQLASLIACHPQEIVYTSCATESINTVLRGVLKNKGPAHLVTTAIEHPATMECSRFLESRGVEITWVPVNSLGVVEVDAVLAACGEHTRLISVMLANNETGALQPLAEISAQARERGILVHTDAAQATGKIPVNVQDLGVDFLTIAGQKMFAPKGIGALFVREQAREHITPLLFGGGQEGGLRSGTENVPYIIGLGEASALAGESLSAEGERQQELGRLFWQGLSGLNTEFELFSAEVSRLPNTMFIGFAGLKAADIISGLAGMDVGASAGAACHGDQTTISHVLEAMQAPMEYAQGAIRFSWGRPTTTEDIQEVVNRLETTLSMLKKT
ncbi:MAG: cysteine desulfurase family protein [Desulfarculaceae bacterium]|jgi:cysteine desulfurase